MAKKKKSLNDEVEDRMLTELNDFMKRFNINEIKFGTTHSLKKTKRKKAKDVIKPRKKK